MIEDPYPFTAVLPRYPNFSLFNDLKKMSIVTNQAEYEMVKRGYRDANIYHLFSNDYDNQIDQIQKDGLFWRPIRRSKQYAGFSHKHFPSETLGPDTMAFGVVASDWDVATAFRDADLGVHRNGQCDHSLVGSYLGYPECCQKAFVQDFPESCDLIYEAAERTKHEVDQDGAIFIQDFNPLLQVHLRYFGIKIIPWFPCQYNCEESAKKAKQWFEVIKDIDSVIADKIINLLNKPSSWDLRLSQILITHPDFLGYCTSYYHPENKVVKFDLRVNKEGST
jgi:hypothetical protein